MLDMRVPGPFVQVPTSAQSCKLQIIRRNLIDFVDQSLRKFAMEWQAEPEHQGTVEKIPKGKETQHGTEGFEDRGKPQGCVRR